MTTRTRPSRSRTVAPPAQPDDPTTAYARDVVAGRVVVGRLVRLACERHLRDLVEGPRRGLRWSPEHAQYVIDFFPQFLRLPEVTDGGDVEAGDAFVLQPWQEFIVGSLFGWFGADGYRRFRRAYIETGKGSGKSPMLAGLGLYGLTFDDEPAAQIYAAASTKDQAGVLFRDAKAMAENAPALKDMIEFNVANLAVLSTHSFFRPVSSEGKSLDGKRVHMALIDELHQHPTAVVVEKMRKGTKGRRQALIVEITNSGFDRSSVCWHEHEYSARLVSGVIANDAWFAYVCQLDACDACRAAGKDQPQDDCATCDSWRDERAWPKANPNIGVSISRKYLRELCDEAIGMPSKQNDYKRYNMCIWTTAASRAIDMDAWQACRAEVADAELVGAPCFGGLDLGQSDDLSAAVRVWILPDGRVAVRARFWAPESAREAFPNRPYDEWVRAGVLTLTDGDITNYDQVEAAVAEDALAAGVRELAYDKRFAQQMALHLEGRGITCVDTPQGFQLNEGLTFLLGLVKSGKLCHGGNPLLTFMASNLVVRHGRQNEIRPDKQKAPDKIDGMVALAMALQRAILRTNDRSIYETRGILTL